MIIQLPIGLMDSNCYLIYDHDQGKGAIVDPGVPDTHALMREVDQHQLHIQYILNTHGHFDHVVANGILDLPDARLAIHAGDRDLLLAGGGAPMFGLPFVSSPEPALILEDGMVLEIDSFGNLITNIMADTLAGRPTDHRACVVCGIYETYGVYSAYAQHSQGGPSRSGSRPRLRWAATGAMMSRP